MVMEREGSWVNTRISIFKTRRKLKGNQVNIQKLEKLILLSVILFILVACATPNIGGLPPDSQSAMTSQYTIGPEDVLQIYVWKQPDISVTVPVRSDGKISVPLINDIQAAGRTPHELKDVITEQLTEFIETPTVSVIVRAINSLTISVSGYVNAPGVYKIGREITVVEAILLAGGLSELANPEDIRIIRKKNELEKIYQVNYEAILTGKDMKQNIRIYPGDAIIVP
jgi:polysaccharide export outer membrane protein